MKRDGTGESREPIGLSYTGELGGTWPLTSFFVLRWLDIYLVTGSSNRGYVLIVLGDVFGAKDGEDQSQTLLS